MSPASPGLRLAFGFRFDDLYSVAGLERLDGEFLRALGEADAALAARLSAARHDPAALAYREEAELLIAAAPHLDRFIARLFGIEDEWVELVESHHRLAPLFRVKRKFVQRRAMLKIKADEAAGLDGPALEAEVARRLGGKFEELAFANAILEWQKDEPAHAADLALAERFAAWAAHTDDGRWRHRDGVLFKPPQRVDPFHLVPVQTDASRGYSVHTLHHIRRRDGFALTDRGTSLAGALDEANYCIWCHEQLKDSCSKGLREKGDGGFKKSPFGVPLAGCPLEERISEFHKLKTEGVAIGALAMIVIDNPTVCATGHRICNDCMKSCIYQRQDPVDIPQAETRTLKDVLELPWGFEIYSLLTRWNPLNLRRPLPRRATGKRVLMVGMGPAGFTVAHHLLNDGHTVVGIDGLKIEPLPAEVSGVDPHGRRVPFKPIRDIAELREPLDSRVMAGFGGVAEYGITVRWDKNFLKIARLLVERRDTFAMFGGVRFGGTLTVDDAFALGFDHVALAAGAGKPTVLDLPHGLARGVRTASDFLMALQLTGAARVESIANLQVRMPIVVVGGGLTAIDTATESLAYYPVQIEKFLARYEQLAKERSAGAVRNEWNEDEEEIAEEWLTHALAIREERAAAAREGREPRILELLQAWGGATIAYRKRLIDSPSYTLNHEEVEKALEEGVRFAENLTPMSIEVDAYGRAAALRVAARATDAEGRVTESTHDLPARTILIAAGTQPNVTLAREDPEHFVLDGRYFRAVDEEGEPVKPERSAKPAVPHVLLSRDKEERYISFFGDLHPSFYGNVVKAMGSAKQGAPVVSRVLERRPARPASETAPFFARLDDELRATVERVERLTPKIVEVVVRAPRAARQFHPGQFYRLQNFESLAASPEGTRLAMEGLALTGAWVDRERGLVSTIVLEMGGSSDLCALLKPGEPVILMGPTGTATETPPGETVALVGGGLGNAVLFSIGAAFRAAGSRVLYFAGYKKLQDRYKVADIEAAADEVVWCCDEAPGFAPTRAGDKAFVGNIVEAMAAHGSGSLGDAKVRLQDADRVIAIGSDGMMAAVARARHGILAPYLKAAHVGIGSINSPMQCMMKEICAQCLQPQVDPATGKTRYVFSCFNQDQPLDAVDFAALRERLGQNTLQEKLTAQWIDRALRIEGARPSAAPSD